MMHHRNFWDKTDGADNVAIFDLQKKKKPKKPTKQKKKPIINKRYPCERLVILGLDHYGNYS